MTSRNVSRDDFDGLMRQWLDSDAHVSEPEHLLEQVLSETRVARRLPRWVLSEWWFPMQLTMPLRAVPRLAPLFLLIALLLAAAVAVAWIGSRPRLPDPFGPAANGQVAYLSNGQIFAVNPDGSSPIQLTSGDRSAATPTWSRDGTRFAYELINPGHPEDPTKYGDIVVADADGSDAITVDRETHDPSPAVWSPDGKWLVYSKIDGPGDQIFIAAADGSSPPVRIGNRETVNWSPIFSPDGTKIMYFEGLAGDGIGVMNADGTNPHILNTTRFAGIDSATWHPDGNRIVVSAAAATGATDLWILYADGSPEQRLASQGRAEVGPSWSPAGDRLVYLASGDGESFLLHVADAGGANERLLPGLYSQINPKWSPDGTRIAVLKELGSVVRLTLIDPDSKAPAITIEGVIPAGNLNAVHMSPTEWQRRAP